MNPAVSQIWNPMYKISIIGNSDSYYINIILNLIKVLQCIVTFFHANVW